MTTPGRHIPAAGRAPLALYDVALAVTMRERRFRGALLETVGEALPTHGTVVDVGAGTGTFAIDVARARPDARVLGIDPDEQALARARAKDGHRLVDWREARADALPLHDASVDAVIMSLLLHHLAAPGKAAALAEARRVLKPSGRLHVADWGRPHDLLMRGAFLLLQLLDGFAGTRDHAAGRLPELIRSAGFAEPHIHSRLRTAWGSLELLTAAPR